jgi:pyruvate/2-oxoglutarate dehydrogenase complex dihydrolipoamide dehydrogenase (E3) component
MEDLAGVGELDPPPDTREETHAHLFFQLIHAYGEAVPVSAVDEHAVAAVLGRRLNEGCQTAADTHRNVRGESSMAQAERVDVLVIGSGFAGKWIAWELASAGQRTVAVERRWIGGQCPNVNCLPSKNEVFSAKVADVVRHAAAFGTEVTGVRVDMPKVLARKRRMVEGEVAFHRQKYVETGAELVMGEARFVAPKTVEVKLNDGGTRVLSGERVFLNLGTRPSIPAIPGLADAAMTNIELLELDRVPEHLIVLGGGYVGLEFAQAFRRFGSRVTVLERGAQLLAREDPDVGDGLLRLFTDEGIDVLLGTETMRVDGRKGELRVTIRSRDGERSIAASDLLAALGRTPNTSGIGLELAGVELDGRGYIKVNDRLETSAPGVWALGECAGSPQFTHVSYDDYRVVRDNLAGKAHSTRDRLVPFCLFTDPPLARVGLNETEARSRGIAVRVAALPMKNVLRTETTDETRGFMKVLVDAKSDQILGFTMFGADASEVMAVVQTAMLGRTPYTTLRDAVLAHPTTAEGLLQLFARVERR